MSAHSNRQVPGVTTPLTSTPKKCMKRYDASDIKAGQTVLAGASSRDPLNTSYTDVLYSGLVLGKITSSDKYAPAILGVTTVAYADDDLTLTVSAATAVEIQRRVGATGTVNLVGPPTAGGTVASTSVAYTAINTTTGVLTVPDLGVDAIAGSFVVPNDGSQNALGLLLADYGVKVTDENSQSVDVQIELLVGGQVDTSQVVNVPSDSALLAYLKADLNANANFVFDDTLI